MAQSLTINNRTVYNLNVYVCREGGSRQAPDESVSLVVPCDSNRKIFFIEDNRQLLYAVIEVQETGEGPLAESILSIDEPSSTSFAGEFLVFYRELERNKRWIVLPFSLSQNRQGDVVPFMARAVEDPPEGDPEDTNITIGPDDTVYATSYTVPMAMSLSATVVLTLCILFCQKDSPVCIIVAVFFGILTIILWLLNMAAKKKKKDPEKLSDSKTGEV